MMRMKIVWRKSPPPVRDPRITGERGEQKGKVEETHTTAHIKGLKSVDPG